MRSEAINYPQLATTTDRLLELGHFTKRRGPHNARTWTTAPAPEPYEVTIRVAAPARRPHKTKQTLGAVLLVLVAALGGACATRAAIGPAPVTSR
jgi:hypothetical protein